MKKASNDILKNDALLKEIDTDLKNEQLKSLWDQYGLFIILFVALSLTAAVSFETFKAWNAKRDQELSNAYAVAVSLQNQGRFEESLSLLQNLTNSRRGVYKDIANLQIANIYLEQGKNAEAVELLRQLADNSRANPQMRDIAKVKLASYLLDTDASADEISSLLQPLTDDDKSWSGVAHELLAMLAIRDGNLEEAKNQYSLIVKIEGIQDGLRSRARDMIAIIDEQQN